MLQFIKELIGITILHIIALTLGYFMVRFYSQTPYDCWVYHERIAASLPTILMSMLTICYLFECITKPKTQ